MSTDLNCLTSDREQVLVQIEMDCGLHFSPKARNTETSDLISSCSVVPKTIQVSSKGGQTADNESTSITVQDMATEEDGVTLHNNRGQNVKHSSIVNLADVGGIPDATRFLVRRFKTEMGLTKAVSDLAMCVRP